MRAAQHEDSIGGRTASYPYTPLMRLTYRYRLYPNTSQEAKLEEWLESLRLLYNFALAERRDIYKAEARSVSVYQQKRSLPDLKKRFERYAGIHSQVLQDALFRLDKACKRFFSGGGYPRFKAKERYRSFTYPQTPAFRVMDSGKKIRLSGIGNIPIRYHRPLEGKPKTATVIRYSSGNWYVSITCETADVLMRDSPLTGFDLGLKRYLVSSDGAVTEPLRALKHGEKKLKREQRKLSRKKKGSSNHRKQRRKVARQHEKVANRRRDFLHKTSRKLIDSHEGFAFEKLRVRNMVRNHRLAKAISDAGWSTFVSMTAYKAERAGKPFVLVEPSGTTQGCSGCGLVVPEALADREHVCPSCGLVLDRDTNAAINIQRRAGMVRTDACGEAASTDGGSHRQAASLKQEAPSFTAE
jgi:putative transposase